MNEGPIFIAIHTGSSQFLTLCVADKCYRMAGKIVVFEFFLLVGLSRADEDNAIYGAAVAPVRRGVEFLQGRMFGDH